MTDTSATVPTIAPRPAPPTHEELAALERLIRIAQGNTGQSRSVANFLLAWWNAGTCGGFDLTTLWGLDTAICTDMRTVFGMLTRICAYPDSIDLDYKDAFMAIIAQWRPELLEPDSN